MLRLMETRFLILEEGNHQYEKKGAELELELSVKTCGFF